VNKRAAKKFASEITMAS